ncbi:MAG: hypothetical protein LBL05_00205, partial [Synergistaceae bacterium]|nr:hypothetical protein [Synergistaceae bacterium]
MINEQDEHEHRNDSNWKEIIAKNVDDAISFFIPELAAKRDYSQEPAMSGIEHPVIGGKSDKGRVISDLCFKIPLIDGNTSRALFIIEQQHNPKKGLQKHMFESWYRASDEHRIPVTCLAVYTGKMKPVNNYRVEYAGTSVHFKFNVYSVARTNAEELKRDGRVFAIPLLAAKRMLEADGNSFKRGEYSLEILGMIKERVSDEKKALSFRRFAHNILGIDKTDIDPKVKEAWKMQFRPVSEVVRELDMRDARQEGRQEGRQESMFEAAQNFLKMGFPVEQVAQGTGLSLEELDELRQYTDLKPPQTDSSRKDADSADSR